MVVNVVKFSQFTNGGDLANGEVTVGLGGSAPYYNAFYNNPWTFLAPGSTAERPAITSAIYGRLRFNTDLQQYEYYDSTSAMWITLQTTNQFTWVDVTTSPTQMISMQGYIADSASLISLALPLSSDEGDQIAVVGKGVGGWIITQASGQSIELAPVSTTVGTLGSLASTQQNNSISLVCTVANLTWCALGGPQGTLTYI